jgi:hypothetical protein
MPQGVLLYYCPASAGVADRADGASSYRNRFGGIFGELGSVAGGGAGVDSSRARKTGRAAGAGL